MASYADRLKRFALDGLRYWSLLAYNEGAHRQEYSAEEWEVIGTRIAEANTRRDVVFQLEQGQLVGHVIEPLPIPPEGPENGPGMEEKSIIEPGSIFGPPKPSRVTGKEQQTIENVLKRMRASDFPLYVSPKRDGARMVLHKTSGKIKFVTDDGADVTSAPALESLRKELEGWGPDTFILDSELELWSEEGHWPREAVAGWIHKHEPEGMPGAIIANVFACYWWESEDCSDESYEENWARLQKMDWPQTPKKAAPSLTKPPLALIWHERCNSPDDLGSAIEEMSDWPGSEGVVMKSLAGMFPFPGKAGRSRSWMKYHKSVVACVEIIERLRTKGPSKVYTYGLMPGNWTPDPKTIRGDVSEVGHTFGTAENFSPGDTAMIEAEQVNHYVSSIEEQAEKEFDPERGRMVQAFGSPAGKHNLAGKLVEWIPEHKAYVEPFAGGAAVFFKKPKAWSEVEVLGDMDPEIIFAYRFLRGLTEEQEQRLSEFDWTISFKRFDELSQSPVSEDPVQRFGRMYFLRYMSFHKMGARYAPSSLPGSTRSSGSKGLYRRELGQRIWDIKARLQGVKFRQQDWWHTVEEFDGPDTFFYLDPPYAKGRMLSEGKLWQFDWEDFVQKLKGVQGKCLVSSHEDRKLAGAFREAGFSVRRVERRQSKKDVFPELVAANFPLIVRHLREPGEAHSVTFWVPKVLGPGTRAKADSMESIIKSARSAGILITRDKGEIVLEEKGGPGSGFEGHAGRPGFQGGSAPRNEGRLALILTGYENIGYAPSEASVRIALEKTRLDLESFALSRELSVEAVEQKCLDVLEVAVSGPLCVRVSGDNLIRILQDGRFKTQFETGQSGGKFDPGWRREAEDFGMGIPKDTQKERPIYGYFANLSSNIVRAYGDFEVLLREDVKNRTTLHPGDSLWGFSAGRTVAVPCRRLSKVALDEAVEALYEASKDRLGLLEAQVHGGVKVEDIAKVVIHIDREHIHTGSIPMLILELDKRGIEHELVEI